MEYETLTGAEISEVIAGKPPSRTQKDETTAPRTSSVPKTGAMKTKSPKTMADKTDADDVRKMNADKGEMGKAEEKVGKATTKSSEEQSQDAALKKAQSQGVVKKHKAQKIPQKQSITLKVKKALIKNQVL